MGREWGGEGGGGRGGGGVRVGDLARLQQLLVVVREADLRRDGDALRVLRASDGVEAQRLLRLPEQAAVEQVARDHEAGAPFTRLAVGDDDALRGVAEPGVRVDAEGLDHVHGRRLVVIERVARRVGEAVGRVHRAGVGLCCWSLSGRGGFIDLL